MLLFAICAATDKRKGPAPAERVPIILFMALLGVSVSIGAQTGRLIICGVSHTRVLTATQVLLLIPLGISAQRS